MHPNPHLDRPPAAGPAADYRMPAASLGDTVLWSFNAGSEPAPATVTRVGARALALLVHPPESRVGIPVDGVRHFTDPELARIVSDAGVWRESALGVRLRNIEGCIDELIAKAAL